MRRNPMSAGANRTTRRGSANRLSGRQIGPAEMQIFACPERRGLNPRDHNDKYALDWSVDRTLRMMPVVGVDRMIPTKPQSALAGTLQLPKSQTTAFT